MAIGVLSDPDWPPLAVSTNLPTIEGSDLGYRRTGSRHHQSEGASRQSWGSPLPRYHQCRAKHPHHDYLDRLRGGCCPPTIRAEGTNRPGWATYAYIAIRRKLGRSQCSG